MSEPARKPAQVYAGAWNAGRLLPVLRPLLAGEAGVRWFLNLALPEEHGLREILDESRPRLADVRVDGHDRLDILITQPEPAWGVLVVTGVAYERGIPRWRREEIGKSARARRELGDLDDVVTAIVVPRRVSRDFDRAWLNGLLTFEAIAARLLEVGDAAGAAGIREACEAQAAESWAGALADQSEFWAGYRAEAAVISVFTKLVEPLDPARARAIFVPRVYTGDSRVKALEIVHNLAGGTVTAVIEVPRAEAALAAMAADLPADFRVRHEGGRLLMSLPVPKLSATTPTAAQERDIRHAFSCVLRLQQWLAASVRGWAAWVPPSV